MSSRPDSNQWLELFKNENQYLEKGIDEKLYYYGGKLDFVMKIAGHSNPQTTLNHYVRSENFDLQDTVNLLSN